MATNHSLTTFSVLDPPGRRYTNEQSERVEQGAYGHGYVPEGDEVIPPEDDHLWANDPGIWESIARDEVTAGAQLADYLGPISDSYRDFLYDDFQNLYDDSAHVATWNQIVSEATDEELITMLYLITDGEERQQIWNFPHPPSTSDIGAHIVFAPIVRRLPETKLSHVLRWLNHVDDDCEADAPKRLREAIARHGPYEIRMAMLEPTRSEPFICPEELQKGFEWPEDDSFYNQDTVWFGPDADYETFRDHLVNHWTDSALSQGGVIARECAAAVSSNPMYDTIGGQTGYYGIDVPLSTPPNHVLEHFTRLKRETLQHYNLHGQKTLTLYRGVNDPERQQAPLESWTNREEYAEGYVKDGGEVLERDVPREHILFSHETIPTERWHALAGWKAGPVANDEGLREFAVLGGSYL